MTSRTSILYITYDGLLEPLGQSQVWQYMRRLAGPHNLVILSFEKPADINDRARMAEMRRQCAQAGVKWFPLRYHKKPTAPATAYDIAAGFLTGLALTLRYRVRIVHARSYVASVMALALKRVTGVRYIFDMRGFWADERVEGGLWPAGGRLYRIAKGFERRFLLEADAVVSLTRAAVEAMRDFEYLRGRSVRFEVIPTCADLAFFSATGSKPAGTPFTLGYVGSVGVWYLFNEVVAAYRALRAVLPEARFLVVNRGGHKQIREELSRAGIPPDSVRILSAPYEDMPGLIQQMDAAVFFYKAAFSAKGTAPTRLAELLGMTVPVLANAGVGDVERIVKNEGAPVGIVINEFSPGTLDGAVRALVEIAGDRDVKRLCREVAERNFSVDWGSQRYARLYGELASEARQ